MTLYSKPRPKVTNCYKVARKSAQLKDSKKIP